MKRYAKAGVIGMDVRRLVVCPTTGTPREGEDVLWPTKESDRNRQGRAPLAEYSGVTLRDLIEMEREGS